MIWYCIPTANIEKCGQTFAKWKAKGYMTAALIDGPHQCVSVPNADLTVCVPEYRGYAWATNLLCKKIVAEYPDCTATVAGGDDIDPADYPVDLLENQFKSKFPDLMGIMQPSGDKWGGNDCCLISPWFGREWVKRGYRGRGPLFERYAHYWVDRECHEIAIKFGILDRRWDIQQRHHHWMRTMKERPAHLAWAAQMNERDHQLFLERQRLGFPGAEPLSAE